MSQNYRPINKNFWCKWFGHNWEKEGENSWGETKYENYECKRCQSTDSINPSSPHKSENSLPQRW